MNNNELVQLVYTQHYEWLHQVCSNFESSPDAAEDLLHDVMLKLLEMRDIDRLRYNGTINLFYVYKIARSIYLTKKKKNITVTELFDVESVEEDYNFEIDINIERKLASIDSVLNKAHWYDAQLWKTYFEEDHSLTSLSEATGISRSSVWNTISKVKNAVRAEYESGSI